MDRPFNLKPVHPHGWNRTSAGFGEVIVKSFWCLASGARPGGSLQFAPVTFASGYHDSSVTPQPKPRETIRFGLATDGAAEANLRKPMDSSAGSAMTVPALRRKWRRVRGGVFMAAVR